MTEDELAEIERQYEQDAPSIGYYPNIPALLAEVRRLRAALTDYRHTCSECDSVEMCLPSGYEWNWTCADSAACRARFEAKYPLAHAE